MCNGGDERVCLNVGLGKEWLLQDHEDEDGEGLERRGDEEGRGEGHVSGGA
jgi:hypothetical protein